MSRLEYVAEWCGAHGPLRDIGEVYHVLNSFYDHLKEIIPGANLLVGGSAAFFYHCSDMVAPPHIMRDLDLSLVTTRETLLELHKETKSYDHLKVLRDTCTVISMGVVDLHIDIDYDQIMKYFESGSSMPGQPGIRFMSRQDLRAFYERMFRQKDEDKLRIMRIQA